MKHKKRDDKIKRYYLLTYAFFVLFTLALFFVFFDSPFSITGFAVLTQGNQSEFDLGSYNNTEWNGSSVALSAGNVSGNYISKVFDVGANAVWNNLSFSSVEPNIEFLFAVDGAGDVYKSSDFGVSWSQTVDDYGRTSDTENMLSDSNNLYILSNSNREIWKSSDNGVSFSVTNDSFANSNLLVGWKDSSGNLFVIDASGDVYKSSNQGINWNLQGDFNGGDGDNAKGIAITSDGIFVVDSKEKVWKSSNQGASWSQQTSDYGGGNADDMSSDSSGNLYILQKKDVWKSSNQGVSWSMINDTFTTYSQDGEFITYDSKDDLYINDGIGRVWNSTDSGINWIESGDFNGGASNDPKGLTNYIKSTNISLQAKNCSLSDCSDGTWENVDISNLNLRSRYFQYKFEFTTPDSVKSPLFESISIDYGLTNGTPLINLNSPVGSYLSSGQNIEFKYTPEDSNLDSCELWGDFSGSFEINQTNTNPTNLVENIFYSNLSDGNYSWNAKCNNTFGGEAFNGNESFVIDSVNPSINLIEPSGIKTSQVGIPLEFSISETYPNSCWYNIEKGGFIAINNLTIGCNSNSSFSVSSNGNFLVNFYANDSAGNSDNKSIGFSVTSSQSNSGGGGGGNDEEEENNTSIFDAEIILNNLNFFRGKTSPLVFEVENTGETSLNGCVLSFEGDISSWFKNNYVRIVENNEIIIKTELEIPSNTIPKDYNYDIKIECNDVEIKKSKSLKVLQSNFDIQIDNYLLNENFLEIFYTLIEKNEIKEMGYNLLDINGGVIFEDKREIEESEKESGQIVMPIPDEYNDEVGFLVYVNNGEERKEYGGKIHFSPITGAGITGFLVQENGRRALFFSGIFLVIGAILTLIFREIVRRKLLKFIK